MGADEKKTTADSIAINMAIRTVCEIIFGLNEKQTKSLPKLWELIKKDTIASFHTLVRKYQMSTENAYKEVFKFEREAFLKNQLEVLKKFLENNGVATFTFAFTISSNENRYLEMLTQDRCVEAMIKNFHLTDKDQKPLSSDDPDLVWKSVNLKTEAMVNEFSIDQERPLDEARALFKAIYPTAIDIILAKHKIFIDAVLKEAAVEIMAGKPRKVTAPVIPMEELNLEGKDAAA